MKRAEIHRLDRRPIQLPREHSSYNDDVKQGAFCPADMTYAGKQRMGVREISEPRSSTQDRVRRAPNERFPFDAPIPLPEHIKKAAVFARDCPPGELVKFRGAQQSRLEQMVGESKMAQKKRGDRILPKSPHLLLSSTPWRPVS